MTTYNLISTNLEKSALRTAKAHFNACPLNFSG